MERTSRSRPPVESFLEELNLSKSFEEHKLRYTVIWTVLSPIFLGILAENRNQPEQAEKHYRQAVRRGAYVPARMNLATLLGRRGVIRKLKNS